MRAAFINQVLDHEAIAVIGAVRHHRAQGRALRPWSKPFSQCSQALISETLPGLARIHLLPRPFFFLCNRGHSRAKRILEHAGDLELIALFFGPNILRRQFNGPLGGSRTALTMLRRMKVRSGVVRRRGKLECRPRIGCRPIPAQFRGVRPGSANPLNVDESDLPEPFERDSGLDCPFVPAQMTRNQQSPGFFERGNSISSLQPVGAYGIHGERETQVAANVCVLYANVPRDQILGPPVGVAAGRMSHHSVRFRDPRTETEVCPPCGDARFSACGESRSEFGRRQRENASSLPDRFIRLTINRKRAGDRWDRNGRRLSERSRSKE